MQIEKSIDSEIIDATEFIKSLGIISSFQKVFITRQLFDDLTSFEARNGIDTILDVLEFGDILEHDEKTMSHFNLPKGSLRIKSYAIWE